MTHESRPKAAPATAALESTTPEALAERGWTAYASKTGIEFGGAYRGHHLSLVPWQDGWSWSVTHPRMCNAPRGHSDWSPDAATAERLMILTVDGFGCAARRAAA